MSRYDDPDSPDYQEFSAGGGGSTQHDREIEQMDREILKVKVLNTELASRLRETVALLKLREQTPTMALVLADAERALAKVR